MTHSDAHSNRPSTPLRLHRLPAPGRERSLLRVIDLEGPGPRFALLRSLRATSLSVRTAAGGGLPATGVTWNLVGHGLALSMVLPN